MASEKRTNDYHIGGGYTDASIKRHRGENRELSGETRDPCDPTTSKPSAHPIPAELANNTPDSRPASPLAQSEPPNGLENTAVLSSKPAEAPQEPAGPTVDPQVNETEQAHAPPNSAQDPAVGANSSPEIIGPASPRPAVPAEPASQPQSTTESAPLASHDGGKNTETPGNSASDAPGERQKAMDVKEAHNGPLQPPTDSEPPNRVEGSVSGSLDETKSDIPAEASQRLKAGLLAEAGEVTRPEAHTAPPAAANAPNSATNSATNIPADPKSEPPLNSLTNESKPLPEHKSPGPPIESTRSQSPIDVDMVIGALNNPDCGAEVMKAHANAITAHQQVQAYAKLAGSGWTYYVQKLQVVIGRNAADSTETVDIDLAPSKIVSRKHAVIHYNLSARVWEVFTVGRNGIRIDNTVVRRGSTAPLKSGTVIDAGNMQMMFVLPDAEPEVAPLYVQRLRALQSDDRAGHHDDTKSNGAHPAPSYPRGVTILSQPPVSAAENFMNELSRDECRDIKPPFSYATMIAQSILSTPEHKMTLADIYAWISSHYAFYRHSKPGWQNSIRHNLSLNKAFEKAARKENEPGKGSKWFIVEQYKDELIRKATTGQEQRGVYTPRQPFDVLPHPTNRGTHSTTPRANNAQNSGPKSAKPINSPLKRVTNVTGKPNVPPSPPQTNLPAQQPPQLSQPSPQPPQPPQPQSTQPYPPNVPIAHPTGANHAIPVTGMNYGAPETPATNPNLMHHNLAASNMVTNNVPSPPLPSQPGAYGYPYMTPYGIQYFHPQTGQLLSPQHVPLLQNPAMAPVPHLAPHMAPQMQYGMPESVNAEYGANNMPILQPSPESRARHNETSGQNFGMAFPQHRAPYGGPTGLQAGVDLVSERKDSHPMIQHDNHANSESEQRPPANQTAPPPPRMPSPNLSELHTPARRNINAHAELRNQSEYADGAIGSGLLDSAIKLPPNPAAGMPESSPALWKYMNLESTPNRASPTRTNADDRAHANAPDSSPAGAHATSHNLAGSIPLMDKWEGSKA